MFSNEFLLIEISGLDFTGQALLALLDHYCKNKMEHQSRLKYIVIVSNIAAKICQKMLVSSGFFLTNFVFPSSELKGLQLWF